MAQSVAQDINGPIWPLGLIVVVTPGTPVSIMSLVDPSSVNAPTTTAANSAGVQEYTTRCQQIQVQGYKAGAGGNGLQSNTGNVYLMKKAEATTGSGNRTDYGVMVAVITPQQTIFYGSAAFNRNVFGPYEYYIDADNANDGALVTLIIQ